MARCSRKRCLTGVISGVLISSIAGSASLASNTVAESSAENSSSVANGNTQLVLLGTSGGPNNRAERSQPASLVVVDGFPYLVDAGDGASRQLYVAGYKPEALKAVFLTHLHVDHTLGLATLVALRWTARGAPTLPVIGPPGTDAMVDGLYRYLSIPISLHAIALPPGPALETTTHAHDVETTNPQVIFQDERVKVTAVPNTHYYWKDVKPYGQDRSYALRFDTKDRSIVFTGDTGPSEAVEQLAKGADVLVSEAMDYEQTAEMVRSRFAGREAQTATMLNFMTQHHLVPVEIAKMARRAGVKMVVLHHFSPAPDGDRDMGRFRAMMKKYYSGPILVGRDLDVL